jgi:LacI family transcriptional regulator
VEVDNLEGGKLAGRFLAAKGRRRCSFIGETGVPEHIVHLSDIRLQGFRDALEEAGQELPDALISRRPYSKNGVAEQAKELLEQTPRPDAIFAYSDLHAAHVLRVAREMNIRVPEELAVVGFDGTDLAEFLGLTTVDQSLDESGRLAAELLMDRIADPERTTQAVRLPLRVVERLTT